MKLITFFSGLMFSVYASAGLNDMQSGVGVNDKNIGALAQTSWEYAKASTTQKKFNDGFAAAFVRVNASSDLYSLSRSNKLYLTNFDTREVLGNWPLTRWQYLSRPQEILKDHAEAGIRSWKEKIRYDASVPYAGCLNQHPLRYGDLEGDGTNELVLTLNGELIVFSPEYQRIVFAAFDDADDWLRDPSLTAGADKNSDIIEGDAYQYLSENLLYNDLSHRAHRSYTKIYIGDFDKNGNSDIVTWQKVYVSNKVGGTPGFTLLRNEVKHYEHDLKAQADSPAGVTGEYLPQTTDEATIKTWLTDNALTWKKGYPDVSECAADAGKPIPEMSDPLLNDPEVLQ